MSLVIPADLQQRVNALLGTGRYASEEEILRVVTQTEDLDQACQQLIDKANEHGGLDNVTAILVKTI